MLEIGALIDLLVEKEIIDRDELMAEIKKPDKEMKLRRGHKS